MLTPYINNQTILTFINKAQNKIAELGNYLATELEDLRNKQMLLDLSDFLECLDSPYNGWSETDIIRYIEFWNNRADLVNTPYIQITNYVVTINSGSTMGGIDTSAQNKDAFSKLPHNSLALVQGGTSGQKYHLSKAEYDWVQCQMAKSPCPDIIQPTVGLSISPNGTRWPSGYFELGTSVGVTILNGSLNINSGKSVLGYSYQRNNSDIATTVPTPPYTVSGYTDRTVIKQDTVYGFRANFELGGTKEATQSIMFRQPMYSGILVRSTISATTAITLGKDVRDRGNLDIQFVIPEGNTLLTGGRDKTPVVFIPATWGRPTAINVGVYNFTSDWTMSAAQMKLSDNTNLDGLLLVYNKSFEGTTIFSFSF